MAVEIRVPQLGESVVEATVGKWLKKQGDRVAQGEPVVELETEKVSVEVAAEASGVLASIDQEEGATARVGDVLGQIEAGAQTAARPAAPAPAQAERAAPPAPPAESELPPQGAPALHLSTPSGRRVAEEYGVDVQKVAGTGPGGRVTKEDVLSFVESQHPQTAPLAPPPPPAPAPAATPPPPAAGAAGREERVRLSRRRLTIARRLVEAQQTAAMLTTFNEVDMGAVVDVRKRRRDEFKERHGVGLGFMSFFVKAIIGALKSFPHFNSEMQGEELLVKYHYDIGIAVDTEGGLVVPVVRDADRKTFADIEGEIVELATRARENNLTLADLQGGTFTITNGGIFGSLLSTPILNTPQVGILGMHRIQDRPVVVNGEVVVRPMMYLAVSYDHRVVDGREAVQFLVHVKQLIEDPERLLLEG
ncbi:MAG: 2-oxoglutarate dehydrogenase complex dihydrolipoyllysine-residue succinyltransferase [Dehalococcoidales bacterium]|nr:2-oxoglutarate dehydrogenase complex dihydrolipoyllysine-residue succinyltransferase [Dehalococcoidales bacterium]